jgi:hypothetical protein
VHVLHHQPLDALVLQRACELVSNPCPARRTPRAGRGGRQAHLNLDDHVLPAHEGRPVHLRDGRRPQRLRIERCKDRVQLCMHVSADLRRAPPLYP